ncbi:MAG TPA: GTP-binding protein, partial [Hellea balneolensis]|nr:GTP-binding protein [Hellea balneolensis]
HGKLDLTEAEGLADLIDAQSTGQRRQALRQMGGGLRLVYEGWRGKILDALSMVEGEIDFPDEDGVPDALAARAGPILADVGADIEAALAESGRGETVRTGLDIAIIGAPNAGKSSILNRLARRDAAIVAKQAGTTRDIVDIHTHIAGLAVRIADTAGLRSTQDPVEAEGVRRAKLRAKDADLRLGVIDLANTNTEVLCTLQKGDIIVYNKTDIAKPKDPPENTLYQTFQVSAQTGDGFPALETALEKLIQHRYTSTEQAGLTRLRHRECAQNALRAVQSATNSLSLAPELAGADLHAALHAIKELAGESDIEAVLDRVFSQFCIGK